MGETCVVVKIWEENIKNALKTTDKNKYFQPHLSVNQIKHIKEKLEDDSEFSIYFVPGRFSEEATYRGKITRIVADIRDIPQDMREGFDRQGDSINYKIRRSAIRVKDLEELSQPIKLSKFVKVRDKTPLKSGSWTACICFEP